MGEAANGENAVEIRGLTPVLERREQVDKIQKVNNITVSSVYNEGTSGWLLFGSTSKGWDTSVKIAKNSAKETGDYYKRNAQLLQEASQRTLFVPLYYEHGVTEVPDQTELFPYLAMEHIKGRT